MGEHVSGIECRQAQRLASHGHSQQDIADHLNRTRQTLVPHINGECSHAHPTPEAKALERVESDIRKHVRKYLAATNDDIGIRIALRSILDDVNRSHGGGGGE